MDKPETCLRCKGMKMIGPLKLYRTGIYNGFFSSAVRLDAYVCDNCGHTDLIVREKDMNGLRKRFIENF